MSNLSRPTLVRVFLRKTEEQRAEIRTQAEAVALGFATSISSLSQSTAFSISDANEVLGALEEVEDRVAADEDAAPTDVTNAAGHGIRFQPVNRPAGYTWGP